MRVWAAVFVLLAAAGAASAQSVHTIAVPGATHVETPALTRLGNWEVSVSFDADRCEISCVYRLRRDRLGQTPSYDLLLPPAIAIRVQFGPRRATVNVDPARTQDRAAAPDHRSDLPDDALPAARVAATRIEPAAEVRPRSAAPLLPPAPARPAATPLRI